MTHEHEDYCMNEGRLTALETKLKHKRYELNDLNEKLTDQARHMDALVQEVTKLATILQETQKTREEHGKKIDNLEKRVSNLENYINNSMNNYNSSNYQML